MNPPPPGGSNQGAARSVSFERCLQAGDGAQALAMARRLAS
jgi:hypothetical protein